MAPQVDPAAHAEWTLAAMALRAILGRECETQTDAVELRVSVTRETVPGLAVIEWEIIVPGGLAVSGGVL